MQLSYTIQRHQEARPGPTVGFDYLRLSLALSVLAWHTVATTGGGAAPKHALETLWHIPIRLILPMFFSLSGFLVAASLERSKTLFEFLYLRVLRIGPALSLEVLLSAMLLGPLLTTLSLAEYFRDKQFFLYLLNVVGIIHFQLPGVFAHNPYSGVVNGSLWTVPYELDCYIVLSVLAILGVTRRRYVFVAALIFATVADYFLVGAHYGPTQLQAIPGKTLVLYFLASVLIYKFRNKIPYAWSIFVVSLMLSVVLMQSGPLLYLSSVPVAYATIFLGLTRPKKIPFIMDGDYSYGIYLYAFPIQQTVAATVSTDWRVQLPIALILTVVFAMISWHCVEKPLQKYKKAMRNVRFPVPTFIGGGAREKEERQVRRVARN